MAEEPKPPVPIQGAVDLAAVAEPDPSAVVPSVAAVTQRFIIHGVNITPINEDGSRELALHSKGGMLLEASLGPDVLEHIKAVLNDDLPQPQPPEDSS